VAALEERQVLQELTAHPVVAERLATQVMGVLAETATLPIMGLLALAAAAEVEALETLYHRVAEA
jgi:hypothetical protein